MPDAQLQPPFRDDMDSRKWCRSCYEYEFHGEHQDCCCVCHGSEGLRRAEQLRPPKEWAQVGQQEIERSKRVATKRADYYKSR